MRESRDGTPVGTAARDMSESASKRGGRRASRGCSSVVERSVRIGKARGSIPRTSTLTSLFSPSSSSSF